MLGAAAGIRLTAIPALSRRIVAFGGGVLLGIAVFWVMPEMAAHYGLRGGVLWVAAGFSGLWVIDRYIYPVCPSCSPAHDHEHCATTLHGFAGPMMMAATLHSFLDGWTIAAAQQVDFGGAFIAGIAFHKIPEGIALGVILSSALKSRSRAMLYSVGAQSATVAGAGAAMLLAPYLNAEWVYALLALAAGSFLYLGYHAVHGEYRRRGVWPALLPALTGVAGSSAARFLAGIG